MGRHFVRMTLCAVASVAFAWLTFLAPGPGDGHGMSMPEFTFGLLSLLCSVLTVFVALAALLEDD